MCYIKDSYLQDPEKVEESYQLLRPLLAKESERRNRTKASLEEFPNAPHREIDKIFLEKIGINPEEIDEQARKEGAVQREYFESVIRPKLMEAADSADDWPFEQLSPDILTQDSRQPIPYSVIGVASKADILKTTFSNSTIHNPWAELRLPGKSQNLLKIPLFNLQGENGAGWYPMFPTPALPRLEWVDVSWLFYWPSGTSLWSCIPRVYFNGHIACGADDGIFTSKQAGIEIEVYAKLYPVVWVPIFATAKKAVGDVHSACCAFPSYNNSVIVASHEGDNLYTSYYIRWADGFFSPGAMSPVTAVASQPHWVQVGIIIRGWVNGDGSFAWADFYSGKYSVYCNVEVNEFIEYFK